MSARGEDDEYKYVAAPMHSPRYTTWIFLLFHVFSDCETRPFIDLSIVVPSSSSYSIPSYPRLLPYSR